MGEPVITVRGLRKTYGSVEAVRGIDLDVAPGQVFAFLGPNGAGKTTTVEILEGYRRRDAGDVRVLGVDPQRPTTAWRARMGVVLQTCRVQPELTVGETMSMYAGYYPQPRPVEEVLALVGLTDLVGRRAGKLSGGQQRRLDVALALMGDPDLLFLDEPTEGFDPSARRDAWSMISGLRDLGKTVFLTTHYMDEAAALADLVTIIADGRIVAQGPPTAIGRSEAITHVVFRLPAGVPVGDLPPAVAAKAAVSAGRVSLAVPDPVPLLHALTEWALARQLTLSDLEVRPASLEDAYLQLTSSEARS
ncbi:ABC transporter ATP-binding protein [soil metagenome]